MRGHGRSRQITAGHGRSRQVTAGHGRSRQVTAAHYAMVAIGDPNLNLNRIRAAAIIRLSPILHYRISRWSERATGGPAQAQPPLPAKGPGQQGARAARPSQHFGIAFPRPGQSRACVSLSLATVDQGPVAFSCACAQQRTPLPHTRRGLLQPLLPAGAL
jgi:hypothetical protein